MNHGSYRSTWAEVNLTNIKENTKTLKTWIGPDTKLMAVIKADAYGHGAIPVGQAAVEAGADYLAVATFDEALELREAGITAPLLQLSPVESFAVEKAIEEEVALTVFTKDIAQAIVYAAEKLDKQVRVHIKIDTGMTRIGVRTKEEALELAQLLQTSGHVELEGIYTHFADAENVEEPSFTYDQYHTFLAITEFLEEQGIAIPIRHCANSAATFAFPEMKLDMVRVGIGIVGLAPDKSFDGKIPLNPAMKIRTRVVYVKTIPAGQSVGYGRTYTADSERVIATIPIGYADGVPRLGSNQTFMTLKGVPVRVAGRVCMDQIMLDVTDVPDVQEGDEVLYFGDHTQGEPSLYDIGALAQTTHYEVLCSVGRRVPRVYIEDEQIQSTDNRLIEATV